MGGRIDDGMPRITNYRPPKRSMFVPMTRVGTYSRTNDTHENGPPKSEQLLNQRSLVECLPDMIAGSPNRCGADFAGTFCPNVDRNRRND